MLDLAFRPDRRLSQPVYAQLAELLRAWIEAGRLAPGEKLPATRDLARGLGLARNTVTQAYVTLGELGFVTSHVGQGTFVAAGGSAGASSAAQGFARSKRRSAPAIASLPMEPARAFAWSGLFSLRARDLPLPAALRRERPGRAFAFDFRGGQVDAGSFPARELARAAVRAVRAHGPALTTAPEPFGLPALRERVARGLVARGIACGSEDVAIVAGAQQALDLVARVLIDPGDTVAIEQPGYFGAALAFGASGANLVGVGVDEQGLRTDELARLLRARRVKLVYATPAVQSPTGVALVDDRRRALLELADRHQTPVVEDDYDCELRLGSATAPALKTGDRAGQVIYVGTFSKALFPGLRVGYLVAARPLLERVALAHLASDFEASRFAQVVLLELLASGAFERHVRRVRRLYAERLGALRTALAGALPAGAAVTEPAGGSSVWVKLPTGTDADAVFAAARDAGVAFTRGDAFSIDGAFGDCLTLSFANLTPERIAEGIAILGRIVAARVTQAAPATSRRRAAKEGGAWTVGRSSSGSRRS
jgi:GntR family transcriptional regulator/MocR family aminotransferase